MFDNLEEIEKKYNELTKQIADPDVIAKQEEWQKMMKERAALEPIVEKYQEYKKVKQDLEESKELVKDPEMGELAEEEMKEAKEKLPKIEEELKLLLIPKDPDDDKNVICEIKQKIEVKP